MGAPVGNNNAAKARVWTAAIERALAKRSKVEQKEMLDDLADKLIDKCLEADLAALKEIGDRLEGKPVQSIAGPDGGPIPVKFVVEG